MKVTLYDVEQPSRPIDGKYTIDTPLGLPAVGDEILLRERDYNTEIFYVAGTVRRRAWIFSDNAPHSPEVQLWVQRRGR